jgi:ATP:corrinoid adenosyltransferase
VKGFYKIIGGRMLKEVHRQAAKEGLALCREKITSGECDLIILDEVNVAVH